MKKFFVFLSLVSCLVFLSGCGNVNFFSWVHTRGSGDSSATALAADGAAAFADGDYTKAEEYYQKALEKDRNNSEALYGVTKSAYAKAGLGIADVAMSMVSKSSAPSLAPMGAPLMNALEFVSRPAYAETNLFDPTKIANLGTFLTNLYRASDKGVKHLRKIADGEADGKIKPRNINININLSISLLLNGALRILDTNDDQIPLGAGDIFQFVKSGNDFKVKVLNNSGVYVDLEGFDWNTVNAASKPTIKKQIQIFVMYLIGDGSNLSGITLSQAFGDTAIIPADNADYTPGSGSGTAFTTKASQNKLRGAIDYLLVAALEIKAVDSKTIDDLKLQLKDLATRSSAENKSGLVAMWEQFKNY